MSDSASVEIDPFRFYVENYELLCKKALSSSKEKRLGEVSPRFCRYCCRMRPEVTFRKKAHTIPALLGNKTLLSLDECDDCNVRFGALENDLGKFIMPGRTLAKISGHRKVPVQVVDTGGRLDVGPDGEFRVWRGKEEDFFNVDEESRLIRMKFNLQPYRPRAIIKSFTKIAFALVPTKELCELEECRQWLLCDDLSRGMRSPVVPYLIETRTRSCFVNPFVMLFRRRPGLLVPYMTLVIAVGYSTFQMFVPAPDHDELVFAGKSVGLVALPPPQLVSDNPADRLGILAVHDCESALALAGQVWKASFSYDSRVAIT